MIAEARKFYEKPEVERPGLLSVMLGMEQTRGIQLYRQGAQSSLDQPKHFLDDSYFHEMILSVEEFLSPDGGLKALFDRIAFAFDVSSPEGQ